MFSKSIGLNRLNVNVGGGVAGFLGAAFAFYAFGTVLGLWKSILLYTAIFTAAFVAAIIVRRRRDRAGERVSKFTTLDL